MSTRSKLTITLTLLALAALAVGATLWFTREGDAAARVEGYRSAADGRQITVRFTLGIGDTITMARFEEHDADIVVTVRYRSPGGTRNDRGLLYEITATLLEPVGSRTIVDKSTGVTVPQLPG